MKPVMIVGGGVIGLSVAHALHRCGLPVTVVDAGPPARAASHGNAGWITPALSGPVPAPGLMRSSLGWMLRSDSPLYVRPRADPGFLRWLIGFWRHCNTRAYQHGLAATAALNAQTMPLFDAMRADGVEFEEHRQGLAIVYRSRHELEHDYAGLDALRVLGFPKPPLLDGDELRSMEPVLTEAIVGGYGFDQDRSVRPDSLVAGLTHWLREAGVDLRLATAVTAIEHQRGRVSMVVTDTGPIAAAAVIVCAGAWTPGVMRLAGVRVPIEAGKGYSLDVASPPAPQPRRPLYLHEARVAVTPLDGMVRLAGTMELSGLHDRINPARVAAVHRAGVAALRGWPADSASATVWTGSRPMTPDGLPVIGRAPGFANLLMASGHAMLGVTLAPATAAALADLYLSGRTPDVLQPFDPARFA